MAKVVALTTADNPWDYFDDYDSWDQWDRDHGYHTESYVARIAMLNDSLPEEKNEELKEKAIDEIIKVNKGIIDYKKVSRDVPTWA